jgi:hypothetical protein
VTDDGAYSISSSSFLVVLQLRFVSLWWIEETTKFVNRYFAAWDPTPRRPVGDRPHLLPAPNDNRRHAVERLARASLDPLG